MEGKANDSKDSKGKNKSKSYFDLYPSNSQISDSFNGTNLYNKNESNSSSSKKIIINLYI